MAKAFASQADLAEKKETFDELAPGAWCLTAEGDPNSGVIIGDDSRHGDRRARDAGRWRRTRRAHPRGHRQADQVRAADALPRGARAWARRGDGAEHIIASQGHATS